MSSPIVFARMDEQIATSTPGMNSPNPESNEAALLALALRLLDRREEGAVTAEAAELLVGQLPAQLPVEIPLPEGSQVVGSLVRSQKHTTIVLDTDQSPERVLDFYRECLHADGWSTPERYKLEGFEPAHVANYVLFCRSSRGPALWVEAYRVRDSLTSVRLQLETNSRHSPCACVHGHDRPRHLIPKLVPPPEVQQFDSIGGGSDYNAHSNATLKTDLDLLTLVAHYATQLEQAGWTRCEAQNSGFLAVSSWTFCDREGLSWQGLFFVLKTPEVPRQYRLHIRVDWAATNPLILPPLNTTQHPAPR